MHKTNTITIARDPTTVFAWLIDGEHGGIFRFLYTIY
jgi:hypothetical protein